MYRRYHSLCFNEEWSWEPDIDDVNDNISLFNEQGFDFECIVLQAFTKMIRTVTEAYWVSARGALSQA